MTITINNESIIFKKCLSDINSKIETDIWKAFIKIDNDKIEFEVINECQTCNLKINDEINWEGVVDFLEKLPQEINELKKGSQSNLFYLARQMKFWKDEFESNAFFHLDAIEYLSVNLSEERLKFSNFSNHMFQLIFTLESKNDKEIDTYGRWITKWTGNEITVIEREQT